MMSRYECMYSNDLTRKRKRWVDAICTVRDRSVKIDHVEPAVGVRAPWSGSVDSTQLETLLAEEEVQLGKIMVQLGSRLPDTGISEGGQSSPVSVLPISHTVATEDPAVKRRYVSTASSRDSGISAPFRAPSAIAIKTSSSVCSTVVSANAVPLIAREEQHSVMPHVAVIPAMTATPLLDIQTKVKSAICKTDSHSTPLTQLTVPLTYDHDPQMSDIPMQFNTPADYCRAYELAMRMELQSQLVGTMKFVEETTIRCLGLRENAISSNITVPSHGTNRSSMEKTRDLLHKVGISFNPNITIIISASTNENNKHARKNGSHNHSRMNFSL